MNTKKIAAEFRAAQWTKIIQERQASGKTVKDFCLDRGLKRDAYFYWQRILRESACKKLSASGEIQALPKGWMQLTSANESKPTIEIEINGCRITVDHRTDHELLKNTCRTLRTLG